MVIKEFFSVPILSVVAGRSVAFWSPVVERFHCISIVLSARIGRFSQNGSHMFQKKICTLLPTSAAKCLMHLKYLIA